MDEPGREGKEDLRREVREEGGGKRSRGRRGVVRERKWVSAGGVTTGRNGGGQ